MNFADLNKVIEKQAAQIEELQHDILFIAPYFIWIINLVHIEHHDRKKAFNWEQCEHPICLNVRGTLVDLEKLNGANDDTRPASLGSIGENPVDGADRSSGPSSGIERHIPGMPTECLPGSGAHVG